AARNALAAQGIWSAVGAGRRRARGPQCVVGRTSIDPLGLGGCGDMGRALGPGSQAPEMGCVLARAGHLPSRRLLARSEDQALLLREEPFGNNEQPLVQRRRLVTEADQAGSRQEARMRILIRFLVTQLFSLRENAIAKELGSS